MWSTAVPWIPFLGVFAIVAFAWASLVNLAASANHVPLVGPRVAFWSETIDAFWHLGTGFLLALPARDRRLLFLAPVLSLGLDIDHAFGLLLPASVPRPDHALLFILLITVVAALWKGRLPALATAGAIATHLAVDGGDFPLLDPVTMARWPFPLWASALALALAGALFLLALPGPRRWTVRRAWVELAVIVTALVLFLALVGPSAWLFLSN
ncbi:MAG: hypothetical protein KGJ23_10245 [Euryarchaeota archaeon]|nr:hypothetical protein [Euryarchaeota archaeon]MDE1836985.1 hypothetical protein [Euryarchaeota archaeon]